MKRWIWILALLPFTLGFRTFPGVNGWDVSVSDPTLWVRICREIAFTSAQLPAGDPLGTTVPSYQAALQSILDDFNDVPGSFVRLAPYPADPSNPGAPAPGDSTFTLAKAEERTIDVCFGDQTFTAGHAIPKWDPQGKITGCKIELNADEAQKAEDFVAVLTHELGHCLGLDHPQETDDAVMSYFSDAIRLQIDDRMGLVHLYPQEASFGRERANLGLSCSTQ